MTEMNGYTGGGEFSVVQFFPDDSYEYVRRYVSADEAMKAVQHYTNNVAARCGFVKKVVITDGGDLTCFEWIYGKGQTFPPSEEEQDKGTGKGAKKSDD